jgi:RNA polymerase sigma-70 factor (ECF subfamily)
VYNQGGSLRPAEETALEAEVILAAQRGDRDAYARLVQTHEEVAFRVAYLIVRDAADARDVAQEAFIRAHRALSRFDRKEPFRPWLLRIVTNVALNSLRSDRRRRAAGERYEQSARYAATAPSAEEEVEAMEQARRVWQAVGELDGRDQAVLYLRYFVDASERETAQTLGLPAGTVKSRQHRALLRLRSVIERRYPDLTRQVPAMEPVEKRS